MQTTKNYHAEYVSRVIDSCISLEQLIVTQTWLRNIWDDEELIMFAVKRIENKERELGKTHASSTIDIGLRRYH